MTTGVLTPLQLITGASLLQNQGLTASPELEAAILAYSSTPLMTAFLAAAAEDPTLDTLSANLVPAFSNSLPAAYASLGSQMTTEISNQSDTDAGSGDISKFVQALNSAQGYASTSNLFINSAVNSQTYLANTFTTTNNMITGDITAVNLATSPFASDMAKLGNLINLNNLGDLGSPLALVQRIVEISGNIPILSVYFIAAGVPEEIVFNITNPEVSVTDSAQKLMYEAMTMMTDDTLTQVLQVLNVTTPNINSVADLLNPVKLFPNSYQSLTAPTANGPRAIYINSEGTVNSALATELPAYVLSNMS